MGVGLSSAGAACRSFYNASQGPSWEVVLGKAGHFQFLDSQSMLQRTICTVGPISDVFVRGVAQVPHIIPGTKSSFPLQPAMPASQPLFGVL